MLEDPLEVRHRRLGAAKSSREFGQRHAPQVSRHRMAGVRRTIELGDRVLDPGDAPKQKYLPAHPGLEQAFEGEEDRLLRCRRGPLAEVGEGVLVAPGGEVLAREGEDHRERRVRPAPRFLQGLERAIGAEPSRAGARGDTAGLAGESGTRGASTREDTPEGGKGADFQQVLAADWIPHQWVSFA